MKNPKSLWQIYAELGALGFQMAGSIIIGAFIGYFLDKWLNTSPLFIIIFLFLGIAAAFLEVYKSASKSQGDNSTKGK